MAAANADAGRRSGRERLLASAAAVALLAVSAGLLLTQAWGDSLTADEGIYIFNGTCAVATGAITQEFNTPIGFQLPPGAAVNITHPDAAAHCGDPKSFFPSAPAELRALIFAARLPGVLLTLLLEVIVFAWGRAMFGLAGGLLALAVAALEPSLLGHGHLATSDLSLTAGVTACLAAHWLWKNQRNPVWLGLSGLALGWAILSKVSALELLPLLYLVEVIRSQGNPLRRVLAAIPPVAVISITAWAVVVLVYLPLHATIPFPRELPGPLSVLAPPPWFYGLKFQLQHSATGSMGYLNGQLSVRGFRRYYLEALALKTTLGLLALVAIGGVMALWTRHRDALLYLALPALVIVAVVTRAGIDYGIRYVLPAYPLMALITGLVLSRAYPRPRLRAAISLALLGALSVSSLVHAPYHLGYFNELAGSKPEKYLSDSNLDWGQDLWRLRDWWDGRGRPTLTVDYFGSLSPTRYGIACDELGPAGQPVQGLLALSILRRTVYAGPNPYAFLANRQPLTRIGTSIEIYRLPSSDPTVPPLFSVPCHSHGSLLDRL